MNIFPLSMFEMHIWSLCGCAIRVFATTSVLPGFGERLLPARIRLVLAIVITVITYPLIASPHPSPTLFQFVALLGSETLTGLFLGILLRLMVLGLQTAGSMAAQVTSISQMTGGQAIDPMPAIGVFLTMAGVTFLFVTNVHITMVEWVAHSFELIPIGAIINGDTLTKIGVRHVQYVFDLGVGLAMPFAVVAVLYNLTLGAINKAMPQLMVAFVGAPAITLLALGLLALAAPTIISHWSNAFTDILKLNAGHLK